MKYVLWPFHWFYDWQYRRKMAELGFTHGTAGFPEWDDVPD